MANTSDDEIVIPVSMPGKVIPEHEVVRRRLDELAGLVSSLDRTLMRLIGQVSKSEQAFRSFNERLERLEVDDD